MNIKILKYVKREGFCCLWSFFEAHRQTFTSKLYESIGENVCTLRALQQQRAAYRAGDTKCEKLEQCLKQRIKDSRNSS